ncbi:MAG: AMP-binding protein [Thiohalospira sp.]
MAKKKVQASPGEEESVVVKAEATRTLDGLFFNRVKKAPSDVAFKEYDRSIRQWRSFSWAGLGLEVTRWKSGFSREGLDPGDRVAIMARNCKEWIIAEQAAMALELVVVPIFLHDTADNVAFILRDAGVRLAILDEESTWEALEPVWDQLDDLERILILHPRESESGEAVIDSDDRRLFAARYWLPAEAGPLVERWGDPRAPATIVYTPGTSGQPKGVVLNHVSLLTNARDAARKMAVRRSDQFLSHLPLASLLERICGVYVPMLVGAIVAFSRGIRSLPRDVNRVVPTMMVSEPQVLNMLNRELERAIREASPMDRFLYRAGILAGWANFEVENKRRPFSLLALLSPFFKKMALRNLRPKIFGRRLRRVLVSGTPLPEPLARQFVGIGIQPLQGYHVTEAGGLVAVNEVGDNDPDSVGRGLFTYHLKLATSGELMAWGDGVMEGYTGAAAGIDPWSGEWLRTGDIFEYRENHLYMRHRQDNPLQLRDGREGFPELMEMAIVTDPVFLHAVVFGHGMDHAMAVVVVDTHLYGSVAQAEMQGEGEEARREWTLRRINGHLLGIENTVPVEEVVVLTEDEWTVENGMLTPTFKVRRQAVLEVYRARIAACFGGSLPRAAEIEAPGDDRDEPSEDLEDLPGNDEPL